MPRNAIWIAATTLTGVILFLSGCQFPSFRSAKREAPEQHDRPLNDRQVADVQLSLARSLETRGEIEPALNAYRQAVEKDPRRATGYWRMAILQDRQGKVEESETLYQQALKLDPKNPDLLCDYGYSLYLKRRWAEAEERLRQAITLKAKHARAHNNLGLVLAQTERADDALAEFHKAGCDTAEAHNNLAFVMTLNHRWEEARQHYELALDANPNSKAAKAGLHDLESVVAKAAPKASSIELVGFERPANDRPAKSKSAKKPVVSNAVSTGRAVIETSIQDDEFTGKLTR